MIDRQLANIVIFSISIIILIIIATITAKKWINKDGADNASTTPTAIELSPSVLPQ
jgi:hypothetical protein